MRRSVVGGIVLLVGAIGCGGEVPVTGLPPTATRTRTPTATPTPTPTLAPGANIGFIGVLRADESIIEPSGYDAEDRPIYVRANPSGFIIVIDAKPGTNGAAVGHSAFNHDPNDPTVQPDMQIQASRPLGNGSSAVCDDMAPTAGGVPAVGPVSFDETQPISDALNDFGCRFNDGTGSPLGRGPDSACVQFPDGEFRFVDPSATIEFCGFISVPLRFPDGDTIVTARVRDVSGMFGPPRQIIIRVTGF
jgi:hypothetical protein